MEGARQFEKVLLVRVTGEGKDSPTNTHPPPPFSDVESRKLEFVIVSDGTKPMAGVVR